MNSPQTKWIPTMVRTQSNKKNVPYTPED